MQVLFFSILFVISLATVALAQPSPKFAEMSSEQKNQYVVTTLGKYAQNVLTEKEAPLVVAEIDRYLARKKVKLSKTCSFGDDIATLLSRGETHAAVIRKSFEATEIRPEIGIYTAMIESEFCPCIQAPTGPLGMFQFTYHVAKLYGIDAVMGAKTDDRCDVSKAASGAAAYYVDLKKNYFKDDPNGFLLSVAAYNVGQGSVMRAMRETREATGETSVGYWEVRDFTLNGRDAWAKKKKAEATTEEDVVPTPNAHNAFFHEGTKHIPRFLAAMLIGDDPEFFGINAKPLR